MSRKRSGGGVLFGLIVIVAAIALLFFVHHALPGLFKLLLGIGLFIIALFVALIVVIIVAARKGTKKMAEKSQQAAAKTVNKSGLTPEQASVINKGRSDLVAIRMVNSRIRNPEIKKSMANVGATAEKILVALKEKPEGYVEPEKRERGPRGDRDGARLDRGPRPERRGPRPEKH